MELFGIKFGSKKRAENQRAIDLNREEAADSNVITATEEQLEVAGAGLSLSESMVRVPEDEVELIEKYRAIATTSEIDLALQEIRNELFVFDEPGKFAFEPVFDNSPNGVSEKIQKKIAEEFANLYEICDFENIGSQLADWFYVDGRIYLQKIIDENNPSAGIRGILYIDPLDIRKVKIIPKRSAKDGTYNKDAIQEFYVFAKNMRKVNRNMNRLSGYNEIDQGMTIHGLKISTESIAYANSGLYDRNRGIVLGWLYKAIGPYNRLRMAEDSMLIFRAVRAPQRRAFYVDLQGMSPQKGDEYMKKLMARFKNKITYDTNSSTIANSSNITSMLEDYWIPRLSGGRTTEITTLDGQNTQDMLEEVREYRDKLLEALRVPKGRFSSDGRAVFQFGQNQTLDREEYRFEKFLMSVRKQFIQVVEDILRTHLILRKVITPEDWFTIKKHMSWKYLQDNAFVKQKDIQRLMDQVNAINALEPLIGKYFTEQQVRQIVLDQSLEEQREIDEINRKAREERDENGEYSDDNYPNEQ